jgi:endonuclease/exonuclease/phosphatase family metal-dependent hydrolase
LQRHQHSEVASFSIMEATKPGAVRIMQFNVRTGYADCGLKTAWEPCLGFLCMKTTRRATVATCVQRYNPDILCTQEALLWQCRHMAADLKDEYKWVGRARGTSCHNNETSAIFFHKDRYRLVATDDFMFSEEPTKWGSIYEGASYAMINTWVVLEGLGSRSSERLLVISAHLDPYSQSVRTRSAEQLVAEAERVRMAQNCQRVFIAGDFNADCTCPMYSVITGAGYMDSYLSVNGEYESGSFTYHDFKGPEHKPAGPEESDFDRCIDFVFAWPSTLKVSQALIDKEQYGIRGPEPGGIWPSDHYPLIADISLDVEIPPTI